MTDKILGDRYELIEKIGEGGMAIVYKARDNKLNRLVAVKILKKEFANNKDISEKFKKEAMAVANFSDANIVNVLDVGHEVEGNIDYFVMEYVNGKTLKDLIVYNGKLGYSTAISIAIQIAKALECAHKNNIIHRDVKPQNILVTESGLVKVTDFGIAKSSTSATITNTTTIMGSAHYLSPEQAKGTFIDLRSDIYSLGIVLYEMVTGVLPFNGESPVTIALKHIQSEATEPKTINSAIPDSLNKLIMKCISKESINRYQNCRELINELQKIKENPNVEIRATENYDDGRTIIMEPIRLDKNSVNNSIPKNKVYTKSDFDNEFDDEEDEYEEDEYEEDNDRKVYAEKNRKKPPSKKRKTPIIIALISIFVLFLGGIIGVVMLSTVNSEVTIPDVIDKSLEEATIELSNLGLKIKVVGTSKSDKEENTILEMTPNANLKVEKGSVIEVVISGGVETVVIPDLRDYDINYVENFLKQKGLKYEVTREEFSESVKKGYVIDQTPAKNEEVEVGSTVQLIISKGPEVKLVMVEDYVGKNVDVAKAELESLNLQVSLVERKTDKEEENLLVLEQPIQGIRVEEGATIKLYYGKYEESTINVDNYISVGMSLVDAVGSLNIAGISYSIAGGTPTDMTSYIVKGYTSKIKKGESVKIQVEQIKQPEAPEMPGTPGIPGVPEMPETPEEDPSAPIDIGDGNTGNE